MSENQLIDMDDVTINMDLPLNDRLQTFISSIKNTKHFKVGKVVVHLSFSSDKEKTIDKEIINLLSKY